MIFSVWKGIFFYMRSVDTQYVLVDFHYYRENSQAFNQMLIEKSDLNCSYLPLAHLKIEIVQFSCEIQWIYRWIDIRSFHFKVNFILFDFLTFQYKYPHTNTHAYIDIP